MFPKMSFTLKTTYLYLFFCKNERVKHLYPHIYIVTSYFFRLMHLISYEMPLTPFLSDPVVIILDKSNNHRDLTPNEITPESYPVCDFGLHPPVTKLRVEDETRSRGSAVGYQVRRYSKRNTTLSKIPLTLLDSFSS